MERVSRDELFIHIARSLAMRSTCLRGQVGAVIVRDGRIVSTGYNGAPPGMPHCLDVGCQSVGGIEGCTRTTHAESNCVAFAARHGTPCVDGTMYCTYATCAQCAAIVIAAGIREFVYETPYRLTAGLELLDKSNVIVRQYGRVE